MIKFKVGDLVFRKKDNCTGYWEGLKNFPVEVTAIRFEPVHDIQTDAFPGEWWASELFIVAPSVIRKMKDWL